MKIQKVFKDGIMLKEIYPYATWFQVCKFRIGQFIGNIIRFVIYWLKLGATASVAMIVGVFIFGNFTGASALVVTADSQVTLSSKIDQLKTDLVNDISQLENKNNVPIVIDDNKAGTLPKKDKVSIGCMQFKIGTIEHYYQVLKKGTISDSDAVLLALDCDRAKELAQEVIFETDGGIWNWSVATKEMGAKVTVIKELSK